MADDLPPLPAPDGRLKFTLGGVDIPTGCEFRSDAQVESYARACMAPLQERADALEEALRELVECKDLKDKIARMAEDIDIAVDDGRDARTVGGYDEWVLAKAEYRKRKPIAWAKANALINPTGGES